jgi:hypothetical protein
VGVGQSLNPTTLLDEEITVRKDADACCVIIAYSSAELGVFHETGTE